MGKEDLKKIYTHYIKSVPEIPEWHKNYRFHLIENMTQLREAFSNFVADKTIMAFDTETSGLDPEKGFIVGYSFCLDGKNAYYVPVNHYNYDNNMGEKSLDFIYEKMCISKKVVMFNARFDMRYMEYEGYDPFLHYNRFFFIKYDMSKVPYYDISIPCWLSDTNVKMPSLKDSALRFLGYKMQTFADVSAGVENFYYIHPKDCTYYASSDALCTYLLVFVVHKYFQESGNAGKLDNGVLYPLMHCEQETLTLDGEALLSLEAGCKERLIELEEGIYSEVGYQFKLNSPAQISEALMRVGVDTGGRTKTGQMKTGVEELDSLPDNIKERFPALQKFIEYKKLYKFLSSYVSVMVEASKQRGFLRCNYKMLQVPTGRLASGKDLKNTYFSEINIQSIPKPHPAFYYAIDLGAEARDKFDKKEGVILGYQFLPVQYEEIDGKRKAIDGKLLYPDCIGIVEGMDKTLNTRNAILPDTDGQTDFAWVAVDYCIDPLSIVEKEDGKMVCIKFLSSEDKIRTPYGFYSMRNFRYTGVKKICKLVLKSGKTVKCSEDHKFRVITQEGIRIWKPFKELSLTDCVVEKDWTYVIGQDTNISKIVYTEEEMEMCDIEVDTVKCYYANGVLTHNSAQELRIPANLSREPVWVDAFVSGADVHKSTAIKLFGEESYDKEKRKMAKICNFSILYGATYQSLAERFDMSLSEAEEFHKRYKDALPTLFNWEARLHRRAKRDGTAYTYFGRPRRIKFYFENRQAGFGYRTITNTCIQGTASDLLKLAIRRLWSNLLGNPKYIPDCRFCLTVHDEIDYAVRYSKVNEVLPIIVDSMTISIPEWPVIITVEVSVGFSWGYVFAFEYDKNKERWTPILA